LSLLRDAWTTYLVRYDFVNVLKTGCDAVSMLVVGMCLLKVSVDGHNYTLMSLDCETLSGLFDGATNTLSVNRLNSEVHVEHRS